MAKRKPVVVLPFRRASGLFVKAGEYIADIRPDAGGRIIRKMGTDRNRALALFDALRAELGQDDNPRLADFVVQTFLPAQRRLKSYSYSEKCVKWLLRFLNAEAPNLRLREVNRQHVERLRLFYSDLAPRTCNGITQKLTQALNVAVDVGTLNANPIARIRQLPVDNRRVRFLSMDDFVRILKAARNTNAYDLFVMIGLTGLRPSNARLLTAGEVEGKTVKIPPDKMKNSRWGIVPISQYVSNLLAVRADGKEAVDLLFPADGHPDRPKSPENLSRSYKSIVRRLHGLEWSSLYDLRHFFASQMAEHGATEQQIECLLCHVGHSVTSRYVHHDIDALPPLVEEHAQRVCAASGDLSPTLDEEAPVIRV